MKVLQLAVAGVVIAVLSAPVLAQQNGYGYPAGQMSPYAGAQRGNPQMTPGGYPPAMQGYPQAGYPQAAPGQMTAGEIQQAMYGPPGPLSAGPMPMDGSAGYGPGGCGPGGCGQGGGGQGGCGQGGCGPGAQCYDDGATHYIYGSAELFYARRTNQAVNQALVVDAATQTTTIVSAGDLGFRYEPGVKATAGYFFSAGYGVEGTYFGQFDHNTTVSATSPTPSLSLPGVFGAGSTDFTAVGAISTNYTSRVHNAEINFIIPYGSFQYLIGSRYLELDEKLDINGTDSLGGTSGDYVITTANHLYGGQLGARGQWEIGRFIFDAETKAGVYANSANTHQNITDAGVTARDVGAQERQVAFVGEVAVYGLIPLGSNFTARLGYTGIWITDLALAPDQFDTSTVAGASAISMRGATIIHGFNAGMEFRW